MFQKEQDISVQRRVPITGLFNYLSDCKIFDTVHDEDRSRTREMGEVKWRKWHVQYEPARLLYSVKRDSRLNTNTDIGFRKTLKQ